MLVWYLRDDASRHVYRHILHSGATMHVHEARWPQMQRAPVPRTTYTHLQCRSKETAQCLGVAAASSTAARPQGKLAGCSHRRPGRAALCRAKGGLQCQNPRCGCTHLHSMTLCGQLTINTLLHFMPPLDCHRCTVPLALPHTRCHSSGLCSDSNTHAMNRQCDEVGATARWRVCVCMYVPESSSQAVHSCTTPHWLALLSAKQCLPRRRVLHSPSHAQASHLRSHGREGWSRGWSGFTVARTGSKRHKSVLQEIGKAEQAQEGTTKHLTCKGVGNRATVSKAGR